MLRFSNFLFPESREPSGDHRVIAESIAEAKLCDELGVEVLISMAIAPMWTR